MCDIYSHAIEVVIFLGHPNRHSSTYSSYTHHGQEMVHFEDDVTSRLDGPQLLQRFQPSKHVSVLDIFDFLSLLRRTDMHEEIVKQVANDPLGRFLELFEGLRSMATCSWWERVWVLQEVIFPEKITLLYGHIMSSWGFLSEVTDECARARLSERIPSEYGKVIQLIVRRVGYINRRRVLQRAPTSESSNESLFSILREFSDRKATDARDRIYALLGLFRGRTSIHANYSLSVSELFAATTIDILKHDDGSLRALMGDLARKSTYGLPTWVPDWGALYDETDARRIQLSSLYQASSGFTAYFVTCYEDHALYLQKFLPETAAIMTTLRDTWQTLRELLEDQVLDLSRGDRLELWDSPQTPDIPEVSDFLGFTYLKIPFSTEILKLDSEIEKLYGIFKSNRGREHRVSFDHDCTRWIMELSRQIEGEMKHLATNAILRFTDLSNSGTPTSPVFSMCMNEPGVLSLRGFPVDVVLRVCPPIYPLGMESTSEEAAVGVRTVVNWLGLGVQEHHIADMEFLRALVSDLVYSDGNFKRIQNQSELIALSEWFVRITQGTRTSRSQDVKSSYEFDHVFQTCATRRCFFVTDRGRFGWGPTSTCVGDSVFILPSGNTPFLLRPQRIYEIKTSRHFTLVGDCFLQGLMDNALDELYADTKRLIISELYSNYVKWLKGRLLSLLNTRTYVPYLRPYHPQPIKNVSDLIKDIIISLEDNEYTRFEETVIHLV
ncbi:hypothetical protein F5X99DRAFT_397871 [Biscogniauxia marginata]|nr:hypothetical protein F5X99DRAFT_397871 [Biscogniauxia marginata]